jgi:tetratricopeptide (TPR) repeat protein/tRNA A-37 threonylcarbamoyl transferase component Bud32
MEQIGEGGMGVVYVAEQTRPVRRRVALKIIKPGMDTKQVVSRFEAERQALAMMDHPNIARVLDGGATESGRPYFVMELVRGLPITDYCDREQLPIPERLELFILVCRAVQHAHQKGIIHRDLKPSNILVTIIDGAAVPKVIDFGVAKATGPSLTERTVYTAFQQFIGTPLYMSPEQADLAGMDVDTRSDIYALGVLLYELLTGTTPFDQETFRQAAFDEVRRIIREQEPPKPSTRLSSLGARRTTISAHRKADARQLDRTVHGELDWVVMKALEKDRRRRYETASDFAADVMRYLTDQPVAACPPSAWYRFRKLTRRNRAALTTAALGALALTVGTAFSTWQAVVALRARRETASALATARDEADKATAINEFLVNDLLKQAEPEKNAVADKVTLLDVLDSAADKVGERFRHKPLLEAALRTTIGETYNSLGAREKSRQQLALALAIYEREKGPRAAETAHTMVKLGSVLHGESRDAEAESMLRQGLDSLVRAVGEHHHDTLEAMEALGLLYFDKPENGRHEGGIAKAEELWVKLLEIRRRVLGEEHPDTWDAMSDVAGIYSSTGRLSKAEALLIKVLEGQRRVLSEEHPKTLSSMIKLAMIYACEQRMSEAESLCVEALQRRRHMQGEEHPDTLDSMHMLARLYFYQRKLSEAESLFVKVLADRSRVLGEEHRATLETMDWLATVYLEQGKVAEAEPLAARALEVLRRLTGREAAHTYAYKLAQLYFCQGRLSESETLITEVLEIRRRVLGEEDPSTLDAMRCLADVYSEQGKFAQAEPLFREALEAARKRHWEASVLASSLLASFGLYSLKQRRYAEAEPLWRERLRILEVISPNDWRTFNTKSMIGVSLLGQARHAEAEPLLLAGYEGMKQREETIPAMAKIRLTEAVERLVQLYDALGEPRKAAVWRARLGRADLPADVFAGP